MKRLTYKTIKERSITEIIRGFADKRCWVCHKTAQLFFMPPHDWGRDFEAHPYTDFYYLCLKCYKSDFYINSSYTRYCYLCSNKIGMHKSFYWLPSNVIETQDNCICTTCFDKIYKDKELITVALLSE